MANSAIIKEVLFKFTGNTDGVDKSLKNVDKSVKSISQSFSRLGKLIGVGIGGYSIKKLADMGKQMHNLAFQTGLSVSSLSAMSSAFKSLGSSAGTFSRIAGRMNQGIVGLAMGNPEVASKLAAMGISTVDSSGRLKSSQQAMYEVADWAKSMKGKGFDNRMILAALQEMGFDAASAQKAIYGGSGAFKAEIAKAREQGRYLTQYETKQLRDLSISISTVAEQFEYLGAAVLAPFAEAIQPMFSEFKTGLGDMIKSIRESTFKQNGHTIMTLDKETGWGFDFTEFGNNLKLIVEGIKLAVKSIPEGIIIALKEAGGFLGWIAGKVSNIPDNVNMGLAGLKKSEDGSWSDITGKVRAGSAEEVRDLLNRYGTQYQKGTVKLDTDEPIPVEGRFVIEYQDENGNVMKTEEVVSQPILASGG